jgi:hypothetical protein
LWTMDENGNIIISSTCINIWMTSINEPIRKNIYDQENKERNRIYYMLTKEQRLYIENVNGENYGK